MMIDNGIAPQYGRYSPTYYTSPRPPDGAMNPTKIDSVEDLLRKLIAEIQGLRSELRSDRPGRWHGGPR